MKKYIWIIIFILVILFIILLILGFMQNYKYFRVNGNLTDIPRCVTYYKSCNCFGILITQMTYPPGYDCNGIPICRNINVSECE